MNSMPQTIKKLTVSKPSKWLQNYEHRKNNRWLKYSSEIARRVISVIDMRDDLNQKKLAETLNIKPQRISKIIQGKENMTLETIYKLSEALNFQLITFPDYHFKQDLEIQQNFITFPQVMMNLQLKQFTWIEFDNYECVNFVIEGTAIKEKVQN